jgi:AraC family transcriptional regulator
MRFRDPLVAAVLGALHHAAGDPADSRLSVDALIHALAAHLLQHYLCDHHAHGALPPISPSCRSP